MKKYRMLIAVAIALVLAVAAYFIVINVIPDPVEEEKEAKTTYTLVDYATTDIDRIDIRLKDGYSYSILSQKVPNASAARNFIIEGKSQYSFDRSTLGTAIVAMTSISVSTLLEENPADLATYGFDDPTSVVTITPYEEVGEPVTIILGDPSPVGSYYYAMVEGKPEVYLLSSYYTSYMTATDKHYRVLSVLSYTDPVTEISSLSITKNGEPFFGVRYKTEEELASKGVYESSLRLTAPIDHDANDGVVQENLLSNLTEISAYTIIEDGIENAEKYGLTENTTVIEIENADGTSKKITLSEPDASGYRYGIVAGVNSIQLFLDSDFSFLDIDYKDYMYKLLWIHDIANVARVELMLAGEEYTMDFTFTEVPAKEEGGEPTTELSAATLNGESISVSNGRRIYIKVLSPTMYDVVDSEQTPGAIEYSMKLTYFTGEEYTLDLARLNERQYAAILNGENSGFYVNVKDLKDLHNAIKKVQTGYELTLND